MVEGRNRTVGSDSGNHIPRKNAVDLPGDAVENRQDLWEFVHGGHEFHDCRQNFLSQHLRVDQPFFPVDHQLGNRVVLLEFHVHGGQGPGHFFHIVEPRPHAGTAQLKGHSVHSPSVATGHFVGLHLLGSPSRDARLRVDFQGIAEVLPDDPRPGQGWLKQGIGRAAAAPQADAALHALILINDRDHPGRILGMSLRAHDPAPHGAVGSALAAADAFSRVDFHFHSFLTTEAQRTQSTSMEFEIPKMPKNP